MATEELRESESDSAERESPEDYFHVVIDNCNSISRAEITLKKNALNIKYGPNGTGKSTMAQALFKRAAESESLGKLKPFKYLATEGMEPAVHGAEGLERVLVFDEHYVSQFVFRPDEVVKDSFEIFIKTPEYERGIAELDDIFGSLTKLFVNNSSLDDAIAGFTSLRDAFGVTKAG